MLLTPMISWTCKESVQEQLQKAKNVTRKLTTHGFYFYGILLLSHYNLHFSKDFFPRSATHCLIVTNFCLTSMMDNYIILTLINNFLWFWRSLCLNFRALNALIVIWIFTPKRSKIMFKFWFQSVFHQNTHF